LLFDNGIFQARVGEALPGVRGVFGGASCWPALLPLVILLETDTPSDSGGWSEKVNNFGAMQEATTRQASMRPKGLPRKDMK
jgi:hypothetical protein